MLALQIEVRDGTVTLDKDIVKAGGKKDVGHAGRSNKLRDKEDEILREADTALNLIKTEGSAVAFAEVFEQVKKDIANVVVRLGETDTGVVTQRIENDIIETLKEMIEALKKAQKDMKSPPPKPGKPGQSPPPGQKSLIDMLAELKMIFAMQRRVNARTEMYGKEYKGEQLTPPPATAPEADKKAYERIRDELKDLATRQEKIGKVTKDIATGKSEANPK
jgi:prefoldin subunit 5